MLLSQIEKSVYLGAFLWHPEAEAQWEGVTYVTGFVAVLVLELPARLQGDVTRPLLPQPVLPYG